MQTPFDGRSNYPGKSSGKQASNFAARRLVFSRVAGGVMVESFGSKTCPSLRPRYKRVIPSERFVALSIYYCTRFLPRLRGLSHVSVM